MKRFIGNSLLDINAAPLRCLGSALVLFLGELAVLFGPMSRGLDWIVFCIRAGHERSPYGVADRRAVRIVVPSLSFWMVVTRTRRQIVALTLTGGLVVALVSHRPLRPKRALSEQFNPC